MATLAALLLENSPPAVIASIALGHSRPLETCVAFASQYLHSHFDATSVPISKAGPEPQQFRRQGPEIQVPRHLVTLLPIEHHHNHLPSIVLRESLYATRNSITRL